MKKILVLLVAAVMIFSAASCAPNNTQNQGVKEDIFTPLEGVEMEADIGGSFVIKTESTAQLSLVPTNSDDIRMDAVLQRYREVSARYNCKVSAVTVSPDTIVASLMTASSVVGDYADLVELSAHQIYDLYKGGFLTGFQDVEGLDVKDEKWGYESQKEMMTFGDGKTYGFRNLYWSAPLQSVSNVLFYNEALIKRNAVTNPYDYYENGTWNWDAFEDICKTVTKEVSDLQSVYGFMIPTVEYPEFIHAAVYSNGGQRLVEVSDGVYECGYDDTNTVEALEWVSDLVTKEQVCYVPGSLDTVKNVDVMSFTDMYTVFLVSDSYDGFYGGAAYPLSVLEDGFRWIEFPRGKGFKGETTAFYTKDENFLALPGSFNVETDGIILDALFEPLEGEDESTWKEYLEQNYFFYEEDAQLYFDMLANAKSDYSVLTPNTNDSENDLFMGVINGLKSANEAVEMLAPVITGLLE